MNRGKKSSNKTSGQLDRLLKAQALKALGPPQLQANIPVRGRFRFFANAVANTIPVYDAGIAGIIGVICTATNSTAYSVAGGYKLHSVEVWSPNNSTYGHGYCAVGWVSANPGTGANIVKENSDTSVSDAFPAHLKCKPPPGSAASFMRNSSSTTPVMYLTCEKGSTIDIEATIWLSDGGAAAQGWAVATCTAGLMYYLALDDVPAGGGTQYFVPHGRTYTT